MAGISLKYVAEEIGWHTPAGRVDRAAAVPCEAGRREQHRDLLLGQLLSDGIDPVSRARGGRDNQVPDGADDIAGDPPSRAAPIRAPNGDLTEIDRAAENLAPSKLAVQPENSAPTKLTPPSENLGLSAKLSM